MVWRVVKGLKCYWSAREINWQRVHTKPHKSTWVHTVHTANTRLEQMFIVRVSSTGTSGPCVCTHTSLCGRGHTSGSDVFSFISCHPVALPKKTFHKVTLSSEEEISPSVLAALKQKNKKIQTNSASPVSNRQFDQFIKQLLNKQNINLEFYTVLLADL